MHFSDRIGYHYFMDRYLCVLRYPMHMLQCGSYMLKYLRPRPMAIHFTETSLESLVSRVTIFCFAKERTPGARCKGRHQSNENMHTERILNVANVSIKQHEIPDISGIFKKRGQVCEKEEVWSSYL